MSGIQNERANKYFSTGLHQSIGNVGSSTDIVAHFVLRNEGFLLLVHQT